MANSGFFPRTEPPPSQALSSGGTAVDGIKLIVIALAVGLLSGCGDETASGDELASEVQDLIEGSAGIEYKDWQVECEDSEVGQGEITDCNVTAFVVQRGQEASETVRVEFVDDEGHFEFTSPVNPDQILRGRV